MLSSFMKVLTSIRNHPTKNEYFSNISIFYNLFIEGIEIKS
jgi:hypothetical protein